jgi:hypothetical protein
MTESINEFFQQGLVLQAFQAERNILIWQHIGDERAFLELQEKDIKDLYSFVQQSAQTNFILSLGKLFDNPDKRHPTRCILSFLKLLEADSINGIKIIETTNTIKLLKEFDSPENLISAVTDSDTSLFPKLFASHYNHYYNDTSLQNDIKTLRLMRNKVEAHNEATTSLYFEFETATRLLDFAIELIAIFGMAYHSTIWKTDKFSFIKANAERNAFFVKSNIEALKK